MRVRCSWATPGTVIDPCTSQSFGETEDYTIYIGATPASIITGTASNNSPVCAGQPFNLNVVTTATAPTTYSWSGPGGYSSTVQNPTVTNSTGTMSGVYTVIVANGACPITATTNVTVVPVPDYTVTPVTTTVCQNGSYIATISSANPALYSYQWIGPLIFSPSNGAGSYITVPPIATTTALIVYTVVVTPTVLNCPLATTLSVRVNNPSSPTLTLPGPLCNTSTLTSVTATPGGGTWYGNQIVSSNGIVTPNSATVFGFLPVTYSITIGSCTASTTGSISISQYQTAAIIGTLSSICVQDPPVNLLTLVQNTLGIWSGANVANNTFSATIPAVGNNPASSLPTGSYVLNYYNPSTPFPNVCPASSSFVVNVFNPPTPTISPIAPKCTNSPTVQLSASPGTGTWTGNPGVTAFGIQFPSQATSTIGQPNSVIYTAGQGTCVATTTATFLVHRFNSAALNVPGLNICSTTNTVNLMNLVASTVNGTGTWSVVPSYTPATLNGTLTVQSPSPLSGTVFNPAGLNSGTYTATYNTTSFPDPNQCPDFRNLPIAVLNPTVSPINPAGPFCKADNPFQLTVAANTGSFVPSLYLSVNGLFTPSLAAVGSNMVQYIVGTPTCNATDTKQISVEAFVSPAMVAAIPDQCNTNPVLNLLTVTANNSGSWSGPGVLGASFNPAVSGVGSIVLMYSTSSVPSGLCPASQTIAVNVYSLSAPAITRAGPYCNSHAPVKLKVSPLGGIFGSSTAAIDALGWFNPAYAVIGDNVINYSVTAGPCVAYTQTIVRIEKFVSADFNSYAGPFCKNDPPLDLNGIVQNPGGLWAGTGMIGSIFTPANANIGNSNIIIYQTQSQTIDLCPDTSAIRIQINDIPHVDITRDVLKGCSPVKVTFSSNANTGRGQWILGDGSLPQDSLSTTHTYTAPGTYSIVFNYWDEIGCSTQTVMSNAVQVFAVPKAAFSNEPYDEITLADPQVQFINNTQQLGNNTYLWQIADLYSTTDVNPMVTFPKAGEYRISLVATTIDGCTDEADKILVVRPDFNVFIPNSFTPNFDGLNDYFMPVFSTYGLDTKTFEMEIFDRWGASLYHSKDITKGWDGTINNKGSEPLKQDVYIYRIKYKDQEGKIYTKMGNVTLLK